MDELKENEYYVTKIEKYNDEIGALKTQVNRTEWLIDGLITLTSITCAFLCHYGDSILLTNLILGLEGIKIFKTIKKKEVIIDAKMSIERSLAKTIKEADISGKLDDYLHQAKFFNKKITQLDSIKIMLRSMNFILDSFLFGATMHVLAKDNYAFADVISASIGLMGINYAISLVNNLILDVHEELEHASIRELKLIDLKK